MAHGNAKPKSEHREALNISVRPEVKRWLKEQGASSWINSAVLKQMQEEGVPAALKNQAE